MSEDKKLPPIKVEGENFATINSLIDACVEARKAADKAVSDAHDNLWGKIYELYPETTSKRNFSIETQFAETGVIFITEVGDKPAGVKLADLLKALAA